MQARCKVQGRLQGGLVHVPQCRQVSGSSKVPDMLGRGRFGVVWCRCNPYLPASVLNTACLCFTR